MSSAITKHQKADGVILTLGLENYDKMVELYPSITFLRIDQLKSCYYYKKHQVITVIIDIDNFKHFRGDKLTELSEKFDVDIIFTSHSYERLIIFEHFGITVFKKEHLLGDKIVNMYNSRIKCSEGEYLINYQDNTVVIQQVKYELQNMPFQVLVYLLRHRNETCERQEILEAIGAAKTNKGVRSVDVQINYIRNKLGDKRIKTVIGEGYTFTDRSR